jgi:hypothetical protein
VQTEAALLTLANLKGISFVSSRQRLYKPLLETWFKASEDLGWWLGSSFSNRLH